MRQLRIFDRSQDKMIYSYLVEDQGKREYIPYEFSIGFSYWNVEDLSEIMLNTGLLDKNGDEIYESDYLLNEYDELGLVAWSNEGAMFVIIINDGQIPLYLDHKLCQIQGHKYNL